MLSVHEGELVEVMDISRNEWCLVQPSSRQSVEGWVPTAYLKPYDAGGYGKLPELSLHVTRSLCMHLLCVCIYMSLWDNDILYACILVPVSEEMAPQLRSNKIH